MLSDHNTDISPKSQLSLLADMTNPHKVLEEVKIIFLDMFNNGDFTPLSAVFEDVVSLFSGKFKGFKACDTPYHNLNHTTDVFLAMARLIHGAHIEGAPLNAVDTTLGLVAALMHDVGYIQKDSENYVSGAELSAVHVQRSIEFMQQYFSRMKCPEESISRCKTMILCTDLDVPFNQHSFAGNVDKKIAQMIAASDLLAQTSDRNYLEKLPLLFLEIQAAGVRQCKNKLSFIKEAPQFNNYMRHRLANELDGIDRYMQSHFNYRWGVDLNMYQESIDRTIAYLSTVIKSDSKNYRKHFRRIKAL